MFPAVALVHAEVLPVPAAGWCLSKLDAGIGSLRPLVDAAPYCCVGALHVGCMDNA